MPIYRIEAPDGRTLTVEGDAPPTDQDAVELFAAVEEGRQAKRAALLAESDRLADADVPPERSLGEAVKSYAAALPRGLGMGAGLLAEGAGRAAEIAAPPGTFRRALVGAALAGPAGAAEAVDATGALRASGRRIREDAEAFFEGNPRYRDDFVAQALETTGQSIPALVPAALPVAGTALALGAAGLQGGEAAAQERERQAAKAEAAGDVGRAEQLRATIPEEFGTRGAVAAGTEGLFGVGGKVGRLGRGFAAKHLPAGLVDMAPKQLRRIANRLRVRYPLTSRILDAMAGEALEEGIEPIAGNVAAGLTYDPEAALDIVPEDVGRQMALGGVAGGFVGGPVSAAGLRRRRQYLEALRRERSRDRGWSADPEVKPIDREIPAPTGAAEPSGETGEAVGHDTPAALAEEPQAPPAFVVTGTSPDGSQFRVPIADEAQAPAARRYLANSVPGIKLDDELAPVVEADTSAAPLEDITPDDQVEADSQPQPQTQRGADEEKGPKKELLTGQPSSAEAGPAEPTPTPASAKPRVNRGMETLRGIAADRPPDLIDWIEGEIGTIKGKKAAGEAELPWYGNNYEDANRGVGRRVFGASGTSVDVVAQAAFEAGMIREASPDELLAAIGDARRGREAYRKKAFAELREGKEFVEQSKRFQRAAEGKRAVGQKKRGTDGVVVDDLQPGDEFDLAGEKVKVERFTTDDDGNLTGLVLGDGRKFGVQTVAAGSVIQVDEGTLTRSETPSESGKFSLSTRGQAEIPQEHAGRAERVRKIAAEEGVDAPVLIWRPDLVAQTATGPEPIEAWVTQSGKVVLNVAHLGDEANTRAVVREELHHVINSTLEGRAALDRQMDTSLFPVQMRALRRAGYVRQRGESHDAYRRRIFDEVVAKSLRDGDPAWLRWVDKMRRFANRHFDIRLTRQQMAREIMRDLRQRMGEGKIPPVDGITGAKLRLSVRSTNEPDFFGAPESVDDQKARMAREEADRKRKEDRKRMLDRQAAPLIGRPVDTTGDMFDPTKADAPLFAQSPQKPKTPKVEPGQQGTLFSIGRVGDAARGKPADVIEFKGGGIPGPSGARITDYVWQWEREETTDAQGEMVTRRVSNWDQAAENPETGRLIVHQFGVKMPDGERRTVSIETAARLLGFDSARSKAVGKSVASVVRSLAKLRVEEAELTQQLAVAKAAESKVRAMEPPPIVSGGAYQVEKGPRQGEVLGWKWTMGAESVTDYDSSVKTQPARPRQEVAEILSDRWFRSQYVKESGGFRDPSSFESAIRAVRNKIASGEARLESSLSASITTGTGSTGERFSIGAHDVNPDRSYWLTSDGLFTYAPEQNHDVVVRGMGYKGEDDALDKGLIRIVGVPRNEGSEDRGTMYYVARSTPTQRQSAAIEALSESGISMIRDRENYAEDALGDSGDRFSLGATPPGPAMRDAAMQGMPMFSIGGHDYLQGTERDDQSYWVSTRNPSSPKPNAPDPLFRSLVITGDDVMANPKRARRVASLLRRYNVLTTDSRKPSDVVREFKELVVNNLLFIYNSVPEDISRRSRKWYDGGRTIVEEEAKKSGYYRPAVAAVFAVLSPQKDWYQNVYLGRAVINTHRTSADKSVTPDMLRRSRDFDGMSTKRVQETLRGMVGRKYKDYSPYEKAVYVRLYDETYTDGSYPAIAPEGDKLGVKQKKRGEGIQKVIWQTFPAIVKALTVLDDPSRGNISAMLGNEHKVRNFFNNLLLPRIKMGDVTIDTHAVAAGLLQPVGQIDIEVKHNLGAGASDKLLGVSGIYGLYADAYREAAERAGILPRELQSVTWEAVRGLFDPAQKVRIKSRAKSLWSEYASKRKNIHETRQAIVDLGGGFRPPDWVGKGRGGQSGSRSAEENGPSVEPEGVYRGLRDDRGPAERASIRNRKVDSGAFQVGDEQLEFELSRNPFVPRRESDRGERDRGAGAAVPGAWQVSVVAKRFVADSKIAPVNPVGMKVRLRTPQDMHAVANLFRNPHFEAFRWVFIKRGRVVRVVNVSARRHDTVTLTWNQSRTDAENDTRRLGELAEEVGADAYFVTHNHPSGDSTPSEADIVTTARVWGNLTGPGVVSRVSPGLQKLRFLGHIVTDHSRHSVIDANGRFDRVDVAANLGKPDPLLGPPLTETRIDNPAAAAEAIVKLVGHGDGPEARGISVIITNTRGEVNMVLEVPETDELGQIINAIQSAAREVGGNAAFGYFWGDSAKARTVAPLLMQAGALRDAFSRDFPGGMATVGVQSGVLRVAENANPTEYQVADRGDAMRFSISAPDVAEHRRQVATTGVPQTPLVARLARLSAAVQAQADGDRKAWEAGMVRTLGRQVRPALPELWRAAEGVRFSISAGVTPEAMAAMQRAEALAAQAPKPTDRNKPIPPFDPEMVREWWMTFARPTAVVRHYSKPLAARHQVLNTRLAYQAAAVKRQTQDIWEQLEKSLWGPKMAWIPKWLRPMYPKARLRAFMDRVLHIAAHLNVTGGDPGEWEFEGFEMRAGWLPQNIANLQGLSAGGSLIQNNPVTGTLETLRIGDLIKLKDGRRGHQLWRKMRAVDQEGVYAMAAEKWPEFQWFLDMWLDPALRHGRVEINGVTIPLFNRASLADMYAEGDPDWKDRPGYTPDVAMGGALLKMGKKKFATERKVTFREGTVSPGRKYETGAARESGNVLDLLSGYAVRAKQVLEEDTRKLWFRDVMASAVDMPGNDLPEGWVPVSDAMLEVWRAVKAMQNFDDPLEYPQTTERLRDDESPEYQRFWGEMLRLKAASKPKIVPRPLVEALVKQMVTRKELGKVAKVVQVAEANWKANNLLMPDTFVENRTDNYLRLMIEGYRRVILAGIKGGDRETFSEALKLAWTGMVNVVPGVRQMTGANDNALFNRIKDKVLPDELFEGSTHMADMRINRPGVEADVESAAMQGRWARVAGLVAMNLGPLLLEKSGYGQLDVSAKKQMVFALLLNKAERAAFAAGHRGKAAQPFIESWMADPPEAVIADAIGQAHRLLLNYSDSPGWLAKAARIPGFNWLVAYPLFRYHFIGRELDRATAAFRGLYRTLVRGKKLTRDEWAESLADTISYVTLPLAGYTAAKVAEALADSLLGGDDDDEEKNPRMLVGSSEVIVEDPDEEGKTKRKHVARELVTANRVNVSELLRRAHLGGEGETDYWVHVKDFPIVRSTAVAYQAIEDARKHGIGQGIATLWGAMGELLQSLSGVGQVAKVPIVGTQKAYGEMRGDENRASVLDPYATAMPIDAYLTSQFLNLIPGQRQANEALKWLDPTPRRETRSKYLDYDPGVKEVLQAEGWTAVIDRLARGAATGSAESPLPPQGQINRRLGIVETPREFTRAQRIAALVGFNLKPIPREEYAEAMAGD